MNVLLNPKCLNADSLANSRFLVNISESLYFLSNLDSLINLLRKGFGWFRLGQLWSAVNSVPWSNKSNKPVKPVNWVDSVSRAGESLIQLAQVTSSHTESTRLTSGVAWWCVRWRPLMRFELQIHLTIWFDLWPQFYEIQSVQKDRAVWRFSSKGKSLTAYWENHRRRWILLEVVAEAKRSLFFLELKYLQRFEDNSVFVTKRRNVGFFK